VRQGTPLHPGKQDTQIWLYFIVRSNRCHAVQEMAPYMTIAADPVLLWNEIGTKADERNHLWNAAELAEKRKDARTAREYEIALPSELSEQQREHLAQEFSRLLANRYGVAIDLAIHSPSKEGDERNHHAHLLATTRQVERAPNGNLVLRDKASIELSDKKRRELGLGAVADEITKVRKLWGELANQHLKLAGHTERIDSRSLADQGIDRIPTQHLGPRATAIERRTGQYSCKRINQLFERKEQIENAREEKKLAKEYKETEKIVINLSNKLQIAKLEHQEQIIIKEGLQDIWNAFDKYEKEKEQAIVAERLAKKKEQELKERQRKNQSQSRRGYSR